MPNHSYIKTRKGTVDLQELKECIDLRKIYGETNLYCPWHKDTVTPNLHVYSNHVYCFACGAARDAISFVMYMEKLDFMGAVEFLQQHKNSNIEHAVSVEPVSKEEVNRLNAQLFAAFGEEARLYLCNRGLMDAALWRDLLLGYDFNHIAIPHFANGNCVNIKFRNLGTLGPKYNSMQGMEFNYLYPYDYFRQHFADSKTLYLTEGEFDCMLLLQENLPAMSLPAGANTPLENHIPFLKRFERVNLLFDLDEAGKKAGDRIFFSKMKTGYTIAEMCWNTAFLRGNWPAEFGKDLTEARTYILSKLKSDYAQRV